MSKYVEGEGTFLLSLRQISEKPARKEWNSIEVHFNQQLSQLRNFLGSFSKHWLNTPFKSLNILDKYS